MLKSVLRKFSAAHTQSVVFFPPKNPCLMRASTRKIVSQFDDATFLKKFFSRNVTKLVTKETHLVSELLNKGCGKFGVVIIFVRARRRRHQRGI
jgi:DNA mismatch repair ATPase MutS